MSLPYQPSPTIAYSAGFGSAILPWAYSFYPLNRTLFLDFLDNVNTTITKNFERDYTFTSDDREFLADTHNKLKHYFNESISIKGIHDLGMENTKRWYSHDTLDETFWVIEDEPEMVSALIKDTTKILTKKRASLESSPFFKAGRILGEIPTWGTTGTFMISSIVQTLNQDGVIAPEDNESYIEEAFALYNKEYERQQEQFEFIIDLQKALFKAVKSGIPYNINNKSLIAEILKKYSFDFSSKAKYARNELEKSFNIKLTIEDRELLDALNAFNVFYLQAAFGPIRKLEQPFLFEDHYFTKTSWALYGHFYSIIERFESLQNVLRVDTHEIGKDSKRKSAGRNRLSQAKLERCIQIATEWREAKENGIRKSAFCKDKHIRVTELDTILRTLRRIKAD